MSNINRQPRSQPTRRARIVETVALTIGAGSIAAALAILANAIAAWVVG